MSQEPAARLLHAAEYGDNNTLAELLQSSPPDVQNASLFTPFILAAYSVDTDIAGMKMLVEKGANIHATTLSGNNAFMMASQRGHTEALEYLHSIMKTPVNQIHNKSGDTPLMFASKNGHLQTVKELVRLGAKPNIVNSSGMTAISFHEGHADVIKELIAPPVSNASELLQTKDTNGNTPLHFAAYGGHIKAVEFLLEHGVSPFVRNKHDKSPLMDVNELLPTLTDENLVKNVTACQAILVSKSKQLEEISQKNMADLIGLDNPEPTKKHTAKHKAKPKKSKNTNNSQQVTNTQATQQQADAHVSNEATGAQVTNAIDAQATDTQVSNAQASNLRVNIEQVTNAPVTNEQVTSGTEELKQNSLTKQTDTDKQAPSSKPTTNIDSGSVNNAKYEIPKSHRRRNPTGKSPPSSLLHTAPSSVTPTNTKSPNLAPPPGFPMHVTTSSQTLTNIPSTSTPTPTISTSTNTTTITHVERSESPPNQYAILDQAMVHLSGLELSTVTGNNHALETMFKDYTDMTTAMSTIHPNSVALDLSARAMFGLGLEDLSMEQLGVLEETHHKMLQAITDAKLEVVRSQERMRLEEQKQLEIAILKTKLRSNVE